MRKFTLFIILILFTNCYSYKLIDPTQEVLPETAATPANRSGVSRTGKIDQAMRTKENVVAQTRAKNANDNPTLSSDKELVKKGSANDTVQPKGIAGDIKLYLKPNGYYKIYSKDKQYSIIATKWEGDTLVAHPKKKENEVLKFHKNDIDLNAMYARKFSKRRSDILTVGAYAAGLTAVVLLLK